jgi:hypothetical protein
MYTLSLALVQKLGPVTFDGLGIFANGEFSFVDLDNCVSGNGAVELWAEAVLLRCGSYAEFSPSGRGLHIFVRGAVSKAAKVNGCEIYSRARYFTVTGRHVPGTPTAVATMDADALEELQSDIADGSLRPGGASRVGIIARRGLDSGERKTKLAKALSDDLSDYANDRSSAVHGALQMLARKHGGDAGRMRAEFEDSALCRSWGGKWTRLADAEIEKALRRWKENGSPAWDEPETQWRLVRYSDIQAKPIEWFWRGYLAAGKLTMLNGEPGHGKSLVSLDLAARLTAGKAWPDGQSNEVPPASVLLLTEEEDPADTIKPRFLAAGGDPAKLFFLSRSSLFRIESGADELRKLIETQVPDIKLIVLDPVSDYTGADINSDGEVRPALNALAALAVDLGIAVVGINHLNKRSDVRGTHRVQGARGWVSVARLNYLVGKRDDGTRHLAPLKNNLTRGDTSLCFEIVSRGIREASLRIDEIPRIEWTGSSTATADELTAPIDRAQESKGGKAEDWLRNALTNGEWRPTSELFDAGRVLGFAERTLQRAANRVGITKKQGGMPAKTFWRLGQDAGGDC